MAGSREVKVGLVSVLPERSDVVEVGDDSILDGMSEAHYTAFPKRVIPKAIIGRKYLNVHRERRKWSLPVVYVLQFEYTDCRMSRTSDKCAKDVLHQPGLSKSARKPQLSHVRYYRLRAIFALRYEPR